MKDTNTHWILKMPKSMDNMNSYRRVKKWESLRKTYEEY